MEFSPTMAGAILLLATAISGVVMWWVGRIADHPRNLAHSATLKQQLSEQEQDQRCQNAA
jgi:hypothetical protein